MIPYKKGLDALPPDVDTVNVTAAHALLLIPASAAKDWDIQTSRKRTILHYYYK